MITKKSVIFVIDSSHNFLITRIVIYYSHVFVCVNALLPKQSFTWISIWFFEKLFLWMNNMAYVMSSPLLLYHTLFHIILSIPRYLQESFDNHRLSQNITKFVMICKVIIWIAKKDYEQYKDMKNNYKIICWEFVMYSINTVLTLRLNL